MNRTFITLTVLFILAGCSEDNPVSPDSHSVYGPRLQGNVVLRTQAEVNELQGVRVITGNLLIQGDESLDDLTPLQSLQLIGGSLTIEKCAALTSLAPLDSLQLIVHTLSVRTNTMIKNLRGLDHADVNRSVIIANNDGLTDLSGLEKLRKVSFNLNVSYCDLLVDISALSGVTDLANAAVYIRNNPILDQCVVSEMVSTWVCESLVVADNGDCQ